jgi:hypothetical protein
MMPADCLLFEETIVIYADRLSLASCSKTPRSPVNDVQFNGLIERRPEIQKTSTHEQRSNSSF